MYSTAIHFGWKENVWWCVLAYVLVMFSYFNMQLIFFFSSSPFNIMVHTTNKLGLFQGQNS